MAISAFPIPGDADFPLNGMFTKPTHDEVGRFIRWRKINTSISSLPDKMKQYLEQLRKECSDRMVNIVIDPETDKPSKVQKQKLFI